MLKNYTTGRRSLPDFCVLSIHYQLTDMLSKDNLFTIFSKGLILLVNFFMVVLTARIWGSEGRGEIALVIANVSIISIFSNIFCGSTVAYNACSRQRELLLIISLAGAILTSVAGPVFFQYFFIRVISYRFFSSASLFQ